MSLLWRQVIAAYVILAAVMAWWYPAPALVQTELVDWGRRYESHFAPPASSLTARMAGIAAPRFLSAPLPLTEFIAGRTENSLTVIHEPFWENVFEKMEQRFASGQRPEFFCKPEQAPFISSEQKISGYLEHRDEKGIRHLKYRLLSAGQFGGKDIPSGLKFPLRAYWFILGPVGLGALIWGFFRGGDKDLVAASSAGKGMRWSAVLAACFSVAMLWPFVTRRMEDDVSFALIMIGGLLFLGGLVGACFFGLQAARLKKMIREKRYLAHFVFDSEAWAAFARWHQKQEAARKKLLWLIIGVVSLVIGAVFMAVLQNQAAIVVGGVLLTLMAFLWIIAVVLPHRNLDRSRGRSGEVYVGERSVYLNGSMHSWDLPGTRFENAVFNTRPLPHILLIYSHLAMAGTTLFFWRQQNRIRIPIPKGQESIGQDLVDQLKEHNQRR